MYLYYNSDGKLVEFINDESIRQGNDNYNRIYVYLDGITFNTLNISIKVDGELLVPSAAFGTNTITKEIPYDKDRDLKYFQDFKEYTFYYYDLTDATLAHDGLGIGTIQAITGVTINTLGEFTFNIEDSVIVEDPTITTSQYDQLLENIAAERESFEQSIADKQDKHDTDINALADENQTVVGAINGNYSKISSLDTRMGTAEGNISDNAGNITNLQGRVSTIENTFSTGEIPLGAYTSTLDPSVSGNVATIVTAALAQFQVSQAQAGNTFIYTQTITGGVDRNYKFIYSETNNSWSYYEIPPAEKASNSEYGILKGNYGEGDNEEISIVGGEIQGIYAKNNANTQEGVKTYLNRLETKQSEIINGTQQVANAAKATNDGNGNNIVNTYLTKGTGASKQEVVDYAQPKEFSQVLYLNDDEIKDSAPSIAETKTLTTSSVGEHVFYEDADNYGWLSNGVLENAKFDLSSRNSAGAKYYIYASRPCVVQFKQVLYALRGTTETELATTYSGAITFAGTNTYQEVRMDAPFTSLGNDVYHWNENGVVSTSTNPSDPLVTSGTDKLEVKLYVVIDESTSTTFTMVTSETYPTTIKMDSHSYTQIVQSGDLGEIPVLYAKYESETSNVVNFKTELTTTAINKGATTDTLTDKAECLVYLDFANQTIEQSDTLTITDSTNTARQITLNDTENATIDDIFGVEGFNNKYAVVRLTIYGNVIIAQGLTNSKRIGSKMNANNPVGTGSFSLNRKAGTIASAYSVAAGQNTTASGTGACATGTSTKASANNSHAEGYDTTASNTTAHAEGNSTTASGTSSHAEGSGTTASGQSAHTEGSGTEASGDFSHAEGRNTRATAITAHAEGDATYAWARAGHAEGDGTTANAIAAHAEGGMTYAGGTYSHAEGQGTTANHFAQHTFGTYNVPDAHSNPATLKGNYVEIVGNGDDDQTLSNARTLDWNGNEELAGNIVVKGGKIGDGKNTYKAAIPDTTSWTADKTLATTDQIPTVNNPTIRILQNNAEIGSFTLNQATDETIGISMAGVKTTSDKDIQFLDEEYAKTLNLIYVENNDVALASGANIAVGMAIAEVEVGKTYTLKVTTTKSVSTSGNGGFLLIEFDTRPKMSDINTYSNAFSSAFYKKESGGTNEWTQTYTATKKYIVLACGGTGAYAATYSVSNLMLNEGSTALPYQAYNGKIMHEIDVDGVLLWENGNHNTSFAETTLTNLVDLTQFKYLTFKWKYTEFANQAPTFTNIQYVASAYYYLMGQNVGNGEISSRVGQFLSSTSLAIYSAYVDTNNAGASANNNRIIPLAIYGIK